MVGYVHCNMKSESFKVDSNRAVAPGVFELVLSRNESRIKRNESRIERDASQIERDALQIERRVSQIERSVSRIERPGQFVEISVPGHFLRRPISVGDWTQDSLTLLVRTVGSGTAWLEHAVPGTLLDILLPLGNGFNIKAIPDGAEVVLAGGGIGIAPLYALAKAILAQGLQCRVALGFRNRSDVFYTDRFAALGCETAIATEDGSLGVKGFVTEIVSRDSGFGFRDSSCPSYLFACGPMPMMRALAAITGLAGAQFSLEARMGCGFGACMGCTIETASGPARVCREGPVFALEDLKW